MTGPSLRKTIALSFAVHLTIFLIAILILKKSNHIIIPSPYTVSLVGPHVLTGIDKAKNGDARKNSEKPVMPADFPRKDIKEISEEKEMVEKKISVIAAKKKIEKIIKLRSIISLKAKGVDRRANSTQQNTNVSMGNDALFYDYYSKIKREIWQQWIFPDIGRKDIEAIISIRIMKDGTITSQRIEKSSGNSLFDRSAIRALAKSTPLSPPPYEMEIGVRFYP